LLDDRELWKRISEGDADAFEAWYRDTAPRLRAFLRHCTGSGDRPMISCRMFTPTSGGVLRASTLIAALFGFGGIAAGAAGIAKILFVVFLIGAIISFIMHSSRRV